MDQRKQNKAWSGIRRIRIDKHGQSKSYKTISKQLDVPVTTVTNVKFKVHGTVTNLPGRGRKRKIDLRLNRRIV